MAMGEASDPSEETHLYSKVLGAYNRLLEKSIEDRLFSDRDKELLQRIFHRLNEISTLLDELKANTE